MSEAAAHNRPTTTGDLRRAIKQLTMMRRWREKLLEQAATDGTFEERAGYLTAEKHALELAIAVLTESRAVAQDAIQTGNVQIRASSYRYAALLREGIALMPAGTTLRHEWIEAVNAALHIKRDPIPTIESLSKETAP